MTRLRKLSLILALLTCLPAAVRANAQSNDLIDAADRGDLPRVRALLAGGAKVNARMTGGGGFTALYVAAAWGHLEVARALLAKGAEIDARQSDGASALIEASRNGHLEMVRELLAGGADVNARTYLGMTPLIGASQNGHLEVVRALLARGAKVNAKLANDAALLIMASRNGPLQVTHARLLARGLVVNAGINDGAAGSTALIEASFHGYIEVVRALLANGAEVNARTFGGITALDAATEEAHADVGAALVNAGAKP